MTKVEECMEKRKISAFFAVLRVVCKGLKTNHQIAFRRLILACLRTNSYKLLIQTVDASLWSEHAPFFGFYIYFKNTTLLAIFETVASSYFMYRHTTTYPFSVHGAFEYNLQMFF